MIKSITHFLIIFFIFQELKSQISQIDQYGYNPFCDETLHVIPPPPPKRKKTKQKNTHTKKKKLAGNSHVSSPRCIQTEFSQTGYMYMTKWSSQLHSTYQKKTQDLKLSVVTYRIPWPHVLSPPYWALLGILLLPWMCPPVRNVWLQLLDKYPYQTLPWMVIYQFLPPKILLHQ